MIQLSLSPYFLFTILFSLISSIPFTDRLKFISSNLDISLQVDEFLHTLALIPENEPARLISSLESFITKPKVRFMITHGLNSIIFRFHERLKRFISSSNELSEATIADIRKIRDLFFWEIYMQCLISIEPRSPFFDEYFEYPVHVYLQPFLNSRDSGFDMNSLKSSVLSYHIKQVLSFKPQDKEFKPVIVEIGNSNILSSAISSLLEFEADFANDYLFCEDFKNFRFVPIRFFEKTDKLYPNSSQNVYSFTLDRLNSTLPKYSADVLFLDSLELLKEFEDRLKPGGVLVSCCVNSLDKLVKLVNYRQSKEIFIGFEGISWWYGEPPDYV